MKRHDDTTKEQTGKPGSGIGGSALESFLPDSLPGYRRYQSTSVYHHELDANEVLASYVSASGNSLLISIADLGTRPHLYKNFLSGGGLRQTSSGNSFGLKFRQASLQGSGNYGLVLGQVSPAFLGQTSGVVGMAQSSQAIQFSVVPPQVSPQFSPQASPQVSPQFSPQASPQWSPQASPQFSPQASPQWSPQVSPQFSPQASPQFSPQASPQWSPQFSPNITLQVSPQTSPQFSPQGSQASQVVFSDALPGRPTFAGGQAPVSASQASAQLQNSGVDLQQLSQISRSSPFSLSEASGADGSFIRTFGLDTEHDVAGWELYDAINKIGTIILGVKDRIGILIEGANVWDPNILLDVASKLDYALIERAIDARDS